MVEKVRIATRKPGAKREISSSQIQKVDNYQELSSPSGSILFLQRTIGNRAVEKLIKSGTLQAKLRIGAPGDKYEQEADRVAEQVMRMPEPVNAKSSMVGRNVVSGERKFVSGAIEGKRVLAYDLGHVLQRDEDKDESKKNEAELTNNRFSPIKRLRDIAAGGKPLSKKDNGRPVKAVQRALMDIGYSLLRFHDDGNYGVETAEAINQFNADRAPASGGKLDSISLLILDRVTPPAGKAQEHFVDYEKLLADDKLDFTLAIGYDEGKAHEKKSDIARTWLKDHGFNLDSGGSIPVLERYSVKKDITYPASDGTKKTKNINVVINLLTPGKGAASNFGKALNDSEIAIYSGHARRGVGPDFDDKKSPAENFVIGIDSALHKARGSKLKLPTDPKHTEVVRDGVNDIENMTRSGVWDQERYRVWFFNACTTLAYMDELRGGLLPGQMNRKNLDIFGTNKTVPTAAGIHTSLSFIEGILNAITMEQILAAMNRKSAEVLTGSDKSEIKSYRNAYFREGAGDNPVAR